MPWHRIPGSLEEMAASGNYLALAYSPSPPHATGERRLLVRVLDATTGAVVNQITPPANTHGLEKQVSGIRSTNAATCW